MLDGRSLICLLSSAGVGMLRAPVLPNINAWAQYASTQLPPLPRQSGLSSTIVQGDPLAMRARRDVVPGVDAEGLVW